MSKLAIDYSDGVVLASSDIDEKLKQYAAEKNIPVLDYVEDFADPYEELYNQICPEEED
jgi:starch synthase